MTSEQKCIRCEKTFVYDKDEKDLHLLYNGNYICWYCHLKSLKSFYAFSDSWLKYKVTSEHGKEINSKIIDETKKEIESVERRLRMGSGITEYRAQSNRNTRYTR